MSGSFFQTRWLVCLALLLPAASALGDDDVSRTVDEDGVVHIVVVGRGGSDRPKVEGVTKPTRRARVPQALSKREALYADTVREAAAYYKLPFPVVMALIRVESGFVPDAVSPQGAIGLMQLMPGTAREMLATDPFDPVQNIWAGCRYLRFLANQFDGSLVLALAAYNTGHNKVKAKRGVPYDKTKKYIEKIMRYAQRYEIMAPGSR